MAGGWQLDGTFLRANNDYEADPDGTLWGQDLSASIKIIAARHDFHDQILGQGIQATLNLDGLNSMRANLHMGGNKITNLLDGTLSNDGAAFGQIAGTLDWEAVSPGELRILDRDGNVISAVNIPTGGGGGSGTVTAIYAGAGLESTNNPIQVQGTLSLENLGGGQTYSGGISGIVIDNYGRVTQVTPGAFANTNLSNNQGPVNTTLYSSTGTGTVILEANATRSGVMSALQAQQLADLIAAGAGGMIPPIELIGVMEESFLDYLTPAHPVLNETAVAVLNNAGNWGAEFTVNGSGVFDFLGVEANSIATSGSIDIRLLIDGVIVWTENDLFVDVTKDAGFGMSIIGTADGATLTLQPIKYNTSLVVEMRSNQNNNSSLSVWHKYQKQS
jgi:hypothetical protein